MKILAFNSSPRKGAGATSIILNEFLKGAVYAGGEVETIYLADKKIGQCKGCFGCWGKTPGKCVLYNDDMTWILEKIKGADIIVYATPLYNFSMTSYLKIMIERTLPLLDKHLIKDGKLTKHSLRNKIKEKKWVIISVCGLSEIEHFQSLDLCFQQNAREYSADIVGRIYRPSSEMLKIKTFTPLFKAYLENCYSAGEEVVNNGKITEKTQKKLNKDFVMPKFLFRLAANQFWKP